MRIFLSEKTLETIRNDKELCLYLKTCLNICNAFFILLLPNLIYSTIEGFANNMAIYNKIIAIVLIIFLIMFLIINHVHIRKLSKTK